MCFKLMLLLFIMSLKIFLYCSLFLPFFSPFSIFHSSLFFIFFFLYLSLFSLLIHHLTVYRGNCILVGSLGQPILTLARLVLYISNYTTHTLPDNVTDSIINDVMKSLFRLAGLEGKQVALIVEVNISFLSQNK